MPSEGPEENEATVFSVKAQDRPRDNGPTASNLTRTASRSKTQRGADGQTRKQSLRR